MRYKVVLYDDGNNIISVFSDLENVEVDGDKINWRDGGLEGVKTNFLILDNSLFVSEGDVVSPELIQQDKKNELTKVDDKTIQQHQIDQDLAISSIFETLVQRGLV